MFVLGKLTVVWAGRAGLEAHGESGASPAPFRLGGLLHCTLLLSEEKGGFRDLRRLGLRSGLGEGAKTMRPEPTSAWAAVEHP